MKNEDGEGRKLSSTPHHHHLTRAPCSYVGPVQNWRVEAKTKRERDMELNLSPPQMAQKKFEGEGGSSYSWLSSELSEAKVAAGKLLLKPSGFALPHYADCSKLGYVLQGSGIAGLIFPNTSEEKVLSLNKGDVIPVPIGVVSWWYNGEDSDLVIVFLGETSKAHVPGKFTYFFFTGTQSILTGFSPEFITRAYDIDEHEANKLVKSQTGAAIIKLEEGKIMPQPSKIDQHKFVSSIDSVSPDIDVKNGGVLRNLTADNFSLLGEFGLSGNLEKLDANAMSSPFYVAEAAIQVTYVVRGSGRVQIVGIGGKLVLDAKVQAGHMFLVPSFFVVAKIADEEGMECFSVITTSKPLIEKLGGKTSVLKVLSPEILQTSFNLTPEFEEHFMSNISKTSYLIPPKK